MELLTTQQLADRLQTGRKAAEKQVVRLGVRPYDFGPGRGLGKRWDWEEVRDALMRMREPKARKARLAGTGLLLGRPTADIVRELTAKTANQ